MAEGEILSCRLICTREINCSCHWCLPRPRRPPFPAEPSLHPSPACSWGTRPQGVGASGREEGEQSCPVPAAPSASSSLRRHREDGPPARCPLCGPAAGPRTSVSSSVKEGLQSDLVNLIIPSSQDGAAGGKGKGFARSLEESSTRTEAPPLPTSPGLELGLTLI